MLRGAIEEANRRVYRIASPSGGQVGRNVGAHAGSTCVAVLVHPGGTEVAHVGDSRGMLLHQGQLFPLTRDHSRVQQMVDAELITPEQAAQHPDANQIHARRSASRREVEVELRPQPVPHIATDVFLLSSDGLTDLVKPPDILRIINDAIARGGQSRVARRRQIELVDLANDRGGSRQHHGRSGAAFLGSLDAVGMPVAAATVTEQVAGAHRSNGHRTRRRRFRAPSTRTQLAMPGGERAESRVFRNRRDRIPRVSLPTPPPLSVSRRRRNRQRSDDRAVALLAFLLPRSVAAGVVDLIQSICPGPKRCRRTLGSMGSTPRRLPKAGVPLVAASARRQPATVDGEWRRCSWFRRRPRRAAPSAVPPFRTACTARSAGDTSHRRSLEARARSRDRIR